MEINRRILIGGLLIIASVVIIISNFKSRSIDRELKEKFIEENYHGIIHQIIYTENCRGFPYVKINNDLRSFGKNEGKVRKYIKVNDSIVKESGTTEIIVYRKNLNGEWYEKVFK